MIVNYIDVYDLLANDENLITAERKRIREACSNVGNIVTFGRYEQDNNIENGSEGIEWILLDIQKGKCLLLSR